MSIFNKNQYTLIYYSGNESHKRTLAYFQEVDKPLHSIDIARKNLTPKHWGEILSEADFKAKALFDPTFEKIKNFISSETKNDINDIFKIIIKNPEAILHPILLEGKTVHLLKHPYDFSRFMKPDGNNLTRDHAKDVMN